MRRIGRIWEQVVSMDNLSEAFRKARKGKRRRPDVAQFSLDLERNLRSANRNNNNGFRLAQSARGPGWPFPRKRPG